MKERFQAFLKLLQTICFLFSNTKYMLQRTCTSVQHKTVHKTVWHKDKDKTKHFVESDEETLCRDL